MMRISIGLYAGERKRHNREHETIVRSIQLYREAQCHITPQQSFVALRCIRSAFAC